MQQLKEKKGDFFIIKDRNNLLILSLMLSLGVCVFLSFLSLYSTIHNEIIHYISLSVIFFFNLSLICYGVFSTNSGLFAPVLYKIKKEQFIALTFDDGPDPESTPLILDELKKFNHKATFFVIGKKAERYPNLIKRIISEGHSIGIHTYEHSYKFPFYNTKRISNELSMCINILNEITGKKPVLFRPPIGIMTPNISKICKELNLTVVGWSIRSYDTLKIAPKIIYNRIQKRIKGGDIILLHDAKERSYNSYPNTVYFISDLLKTLNEKSLKSIPLS